MIDVQNLHLKIKDKVILDNINFKIERQEKIALLGPNGAGKSSLIDIITSIIKPTQGVVKVNGGDFYNFRYSSGVLYEYVPLFHEMKVWEIVKYIALIKIVEKKKIESLATALELSAHFNKQLQVLSKGQKKKLGLLLALMNQPELVILDEPTSDLDPIVREFVWKEILANKNGTLLYTTHLWDEPKNCDRILFLSDGRLLAEDSFDSFLSPKYIKGDKKVVLSQTEISEDILNDEFYFSENNEWNVFPLNMESFLQKVKGHTFNISVLDKELKDIYTYLRHNKVKNESDSVI